MKSIYIDREGDATNIIEANRLFRSESIITPGGMSIMYAMRLRTMRLRTIF